MKPILVIFYSKRVTPEQYADLIEVSKGIKDVRLLLIPQCQTDDAKLFTTKDATHKNWGEIVEEIRRKLSH